MRLAANPTFHATRIAFMAILSLPILIETAPAVEVSERPDSIIPGTPHSELSPSKPSGDCHILSFRSFTIPFTIDKSGARPVEVRLYVAHGPTDSWKMLAHKSPDVSDPQFAFTAEADGEYWFATRTIDAAGNPHPSSKIQPQLKVFVDTTKPTVDLSLDASADGSIETKLSVNDATPIKDVLLRYVTDKAKEWHHVDASKLLVNGSVQFFPPVSWERVSLQLIVTDTAGNQSLVNRLVQRPRVADLPANRYGSVESPANGAPPQRIPPHQTAAQSTPYRMQDTQGIPSQTASSPIGTPNPTRSAQLPTGAPPTTAGANAYTQGAYTQGAYAQGAYAQGAYTEGAYAQGPNADAQGSRGYASSPPTAPWNGYRGGTASPRPTTPFFRPAAQQTTPPSSSPSATDEPQYDLPAPVGGGVGMNSPLPTTSPESERAATPGNSPTASATAPPNKSVAKPKPTRPQTAVEAMRPLSEQSVVPRSEPAAKANRIPPKRQVKRPVVAERLRAPVRHSDSERFSLEYELQAVGNLGVDAIELYGSTDGGQNWGLWGTDPDRASPFDIETKEDGVFSFRIVVVGRNGLASPRPQTGESPDIVVVVDKKMPKSRITAAQYGEGNRIGALVIRYECTDENLGPRPITLSFSDSTSGPWTTIAAGLENDGDYVWPADPKLPRQIYLRLDGKDEAGNVGTYILEKPIDVQGLAPRARIRGFQSLSGNEAFPVDAQTANEGSATFQ